MEYVAWGALVLGAVLSITAMTVIAIAWRASLSRSSDRENMLACLVTDLAKELKCAAKGVVNTDPGRAEPAGKAAVRNEGGTK